MKKFYAITCEQNVMPWITPGKKYEVIEIYPATPSYGRGFEIIADSGNLDMCVERNCNHLNGGNWMLLEEGEDVS